MRNPTPNSALCILACVFFLSFNDSACASQLVTVAGPSFAPRLGGSGDSGLSIISQDGRYILFASTANNLALTNNNNYVLPCRFNVYLRDTVAGTTTPVSVNQAGTGGQPQLFWNRPSRYQLRFARHQS